MKRSMASLATLAVVLVGLVPAQMAQAVTAGPVNLSPDDSTTWAKNVVLTWDEVPGATGYEIAITNDGFGTDSVPFTDTSETNRYAPPVDMPRGDYLWRVRATLPSGKSDWSASADLLRGWDPSVAPVLTSISGSPTDWSFAWTEVPNASFYEVEFSPRATEPDNTSPPPVSKADTVVCYTTHTHFSPSSLDKGSARAVAEGDTCTGTWDLAEDYAVRVRGRDDTVDTRTTNFVAPANTCTGYWQSVTNTGLTGNVPECTGWSNEISGLTFNVTPNEPAKPSGLGTSVSTSCSVAPACSDTPVMAWTPDPDAAFYRVYLSRDRSGTDYDRLYTDVLGSTFQMTDTMLDRELPWYWRVQACNLLDPASDSLDAAKCGPVSDASSFTVDNKPLKTSGASPVAGDPVVKNTYVDFAIPAELAQGDHQANAFRLQVATDDAFTKVVGTQTVDHQAGDDTMTTLRWEDLADGQYFYRYRAVDQTGLLSPWTENAQFTFDVDAAFPTVTIKTASGFGLKDSVVLEADKALTGVNSNTLGVSLKGGTTVPGTIKSLTTRTWEFTPDGPWVAGAAYVPFVAASVTAANGKVAVGDDGVRRPAGLVDSDTSSMKKTDGDFSWNTLSASDAIGKSYVATKHKASSSKVPSITVKFGGSSVALFACKSSASGLADIYLDGNKVKSVDLYKATSSCGQVWSTSGLADQVHTLVVKVTGKKSNGSSGTYVGIDAVKAG